jgi:hypothetical protein
MTDDEIEHRISHLRGVRLFALIMLVVCAVTFALPGWVRDVGLILNAVVWSLIIETVRADLRKLEDARAAQRELANQRRAS